MQHVGYKGRELENKHFTEVTHADDRDIDVSLFKKLTSNKIDHYAIEKRYIDKKGNIVWGSLAVTLVPEPVSNETMIIGMVEDITKEKMLKKH